MIRDKFDKFKSIFNKNINNENLNNLSDNIDEKNNEVSNKKKIENLAIFLIILIITIIIINYIWNDDNEAISDNEITNTDKVLAEDNIDSDLNNDSTYYIKDELEEILSNIDGVGKVKVMLTYASSSTIMPVYNEESTEETTEETDSEGGSRKITQSDIKKEVVYDESDGNKTIITQSTTSPEIEGAIITAEGADNSEIKTNIIQAVEAVTGLPSHRIQVFKMTT